MRKLGKRTFQVVLLLGVAAMSQATTGCDSTGPDPADDPTLGAVAVVVSTTGTRFGVDWAALTVALGSVQWSSRFDDSTVIAGVPPGSHQVRLSGFPSACSIPDGATRTAEVVPGETADVRFDLSCPCSGKFENRIFFHGNEPRGRNDIFTMDPLGQRRALLVWGNAGSFSAVPSPSGDRFAYTESTGCYPFCFSATTLVVADTCARPLARIGASGRPRWSPDGRRLLFAFGSWILKVAGADGSGVFTLHERGAWGEWSPDGSTIAFLVRDSALFIPGMIPEADVYTIEPDGSDPVNLTDSLVPRRQLTWSPDGTSIAYAEFTADTTVQMGDTVVAQTGDIIVLSSGGGTPRCVSCDPDDDRAPAWSPDGSRIAFLRVRSGHFFTGTDLLVMAPDGSGKQLLLENVHGPPIWSPDGTQLAISCHVPPDAFRVCTVSADGSGSVIRSFGPTWDVVTAWSR